RFHALTERADNHERKTVDLDVFSHGPALALIDTLRELLGDGGYVRPGHGVFLVKKTPCQDLQIAHRGILCGNAQHLDVALSAAPNAYAIMNFNHRRSRLDSR